MDKVTFLDKIKQIGSCEDETQRRELLAQLQEDGEKDYDELSTLKQTNESLSYDNESLRSANMKLFLRIGDHRQADQTDETEDKPKREFKNLFDEKGALK